MPGTIDIFDFGDIVLLGCTPLRSGRNGVAISLDLLDSIYTLCIRNTYKSKFCSLSASGQSTRAKPVPIPNTEVNPGNVLPCTNPRVGKRRKLLASHSKTFKNFP